MRTRSPALQSPCVCGWIDAHKQTDVSRVHLVLHFLPGEGEVLRRRTLPNKRRATPSMTLSLLPNVEGFPSLCVCGGEPVEVASDLAYIWSRCFCLRVPGLGIVQISIDLDFI